jgi:twinkle protein
MSFVRANELSVISDDTLQRYAQDREDGPQPYLVRPSDLAPLIRNDASRELAGSPMPWAKTHTDFTFREGELTIWAGYNNAGKSLVMGQCAAWWQAKTCIASFEMRPEDTMGRMINQIAHCENFTEDFKRQALEYLNPYLVFYTRQRHIKPPIVIELAHYVAKELGCKHLFIDSLMKCGVDKDAGGDIRLVEELQYVAMETGIHVHLVHHMRKPSDSTHTPSKWDIRGAGEISDLADNVMLVYRNPRKGLPGHEDDPDCYLRLDKNRHGRFNGAWKFWWHEPSRQWLPGPNARPMNLANITPPPPGPMAGF